VYKHQYLSVFVYLLPHQSSPLSSLFLDISYTHIHTSTICLEAVQPSRPLLLLPLELSEQPLRRQLRQSTRTVKHRSSWSILSQCTTGPTTIRHTTTSLTPTILSTVIVRYLLALSPSKSMKPGRASPAPGNFSLRTETRSSPSVF